MGQSEEDTMMDNLKAIVVEGEGGDPIFIECDHPLSMEERERIAAFFELLKLKRKVVLLDKGFHVSYSAQLQRVEDKLDVLIASLSEEQQSEPIADFEGNKDAVARRDENSPL